MLLTVVVTVSASTILSESLNDDVDYNASKSTPLLGVFCRATTMRSLRCSRETAGRSEQKTKNSGTSDHWPRIKHSVTGAVYGNYSDSRARRGLVSRRKCHTAGTGKLDNSWILESTAQHMLRCRIFLNTGWTAAALICKHDWRSSTPATEPLSWSTVSLFLGKSVALSS